MAKKKTNEELLAENRFLRQGGNAGEWASVAKTLIRCGAAVGIAYCFRDSIVALAGKTTLSTFTVSFLANLTVSKAAAYLFGAGGVAYGISEKKLRQRTVKRIQTRNQSLEERIDPGRSTSTLTTQGETNPLDQE